MKKITVAAILAALFAFQSLSFAGEERFQQTEEGVKQATYGHIDAMGLKVLIESQTPLILLDARGDTWQDPDIIVGAQAASSETPREGLDQLIADKNSLIVVYGYTFTCPRSRKLAKQLLEYGYTAILEYPGGLTEWRDVAHYPIETRERTQKL